MPEAATEADAAARRRSEIMEIVAAVVLATAGLLTAWAGYQASRWDGEQLAHYTRADELRVDASEASAHAGQMMIVDVLVFDDWLHAEAAGDDARAEFYRQRFRPEFARDFEAWRAARARSPQTAPPTPFTEPAYRQAAQTESAALVRQARDEFAAGRSAKATADRFVLASVLLASALFFGGISQVTRRHWVRAVMLVLGLFGCIGGLAAILTLPRI
ncbi:DUF4337 family protein [Caulobacter sp. 17J80-11]|uniref:DUF4337 family protein n=1 Tax=Caulobacter sp. 17J80-11 TaxID=2763502 RepID=UPI001653B8EE|nr:DUF4337 family protein [Caulobacter sp. 17J80-11]MBC6982652.1 DUF4337 family protein [Caulobacter sp. 17J80-11]